MINDIAEVVDAIIGGTTRQRSQVSLLWFPGKIFCSSTPLDLQWFLALPLVQPMRMYHHHMATSNKKEHLDTISSMNYPLLHSCSLLFCARHVIFLWDHRGTCEKEAPQKPALVPRNFCFNGPRRGRHVD